MQIGRRYVIHEPLGAGGMGAVYRAYDRLNGVSVALKRVIQPDDRQPESTGDSHDFRLALAQEFKMLASLRHPHIISVIDYGFDEQRQPYYTMELLEEAQTIIEAVANRPLAERIDLLAQMLQALVYLHRRGVIHRDLKPRNVLVANGQVKVLDFGLSIVSDGGFDGALSSTAGTLAYMAPEVLMGRPSGAPADLYAVGVIAYELLTGAHPYLSDDISVLLNNILYAVPRPALGQLDSRLSLVLERLLAKTSEARYASAAEVMRDLSLSLDRPLSLETDATRESFLQAARLVGRDRELALLSDALSDALAGRGSSWLIGGESGVGKSRLVDELRALALVRGALVLRGQAIAEGGTPYHVWRPVLRWLALTTLLDDEQLSILKTLIPDLDALVGRDIPDAPELAPGAALNRLLNVIETLFSRQTAPLLVILEDLHWANESLNVLAALDSLISRLPLLLIATYRDDERGDLPARLPGMSRLRLERLSLDGIASLSEAMLGESGRQPHVIDLLQRETEGNVFFLVEVVRALAEEAGTLDRIGQATLPAQVFAGGIQRIIQRRLERIPEDGHRLLQIAAVMGRVLDLDVLRRIEPERDLNGWLTACADAAVLEVVDDRWRFAHDRLREGVLNDLTPTGRRFLHTHVAEALESLYHNSSDQWPLLAFHFAHAGSAAKESHYAALAGALALRSGAFRDAIDLLERALEKIASAPDSASTAVQVQQIGLKRQIADARLGLGQYAAARALYLENLAASKTLSYRRGIAEALMSLGDVAAALSEYDDAGDLYQQALAIYRLLGRQDGVARALNSLGGVAYEMGALDEARRLYQESLNLTRSSGGGWGMAGAIRGGAGGEKEYAQARSALREALTAYAAAFKNPSAREPLSRAFHHLAAVTDTPDEYAATRALLLDHLSYFRQSGDAWGEIAVLLYLGRAASAAGVYDEAGTHLRAALKLADEDGETALLLDALTAFGRLLILSGRKDRALWLLALAFHHPDSPEKTQDEAESLLFQLETELDAAVISAGWEQGKSAVLSDALRELLNDQSSTEQVNRE